MEDEEKTAVRPIGIGDALKGVMIRAHCDQIRLQVIDLVERHQLGMMKGGYETGVHTMRALANLCKEDGDVILILDFSNAFNSCNRNLLIKLAVTYIPEIAHLIHWLYTNESTLYLSNGEEIISSEGVHQGCGFSNILFVLLMKHVMRHVPRKGLSAKGSYLDDAFVKAKPSVALKAFRIIKELKAKTNMEVRNNKCHLHAPNDIIARECTKLFASEEDIKIHSDMNLKFLKTPIGEDEFVEAELEEKLQTLKKSPGYCRDAI